MTDPKPSKPILRRTTVNTKVPTLLSVPDLRAGAMHDSATTSNESASQVEYVPPPELAAGIQDSLVHDTPAHEHVHEPPKMPVEPLPMDDLEAAAGLTDDDLTASSVQETELPAEPVSPSDSEDAWTANRLRRDMGTIATIAATVVACTLVARAMKPGTSNDSFAQPNAMAAVEETLQQPQTELQDPNPPVPLPPSAGFAQTPPQPPVANQQLIQNQLQGQVADARNSAQRFVEQGVGAVDQRIQGVANRVSASAEAMLPQNDLPALPELTPPNMQQNFRNAANQMRQQVTSNLQQPMLNAPGSINAPGNLNAPSNAQFNTLPPANNAQPQNRATDHSNMGQLPQVPTPATPADLPAHLYPNNAQQNLQIDPVRSANRYQNEPIPRTAQPNNLGPRQASAYPQTPGSNFQQLKSKLEQEAMSRQNPAARMADQRGFINNYDTNANPNRFEANTYQNGTQNFPGGVNR